MAKRENNSEYTTEKEVFATTKSGETVLVGYLRSKDDRVFYFNPIPKIGLKWVDSLKDHEQEAEENNIEF